MTQKCPKPTIIRLVNHVIQVDAFTDCEFKGNPAAVCLLEEEREDEWLQSVAAEFNFSETCYLKPIPVLDSPHPRFHLRWFAPTTEVISSPSLLSIDYIFLSFLGMLLLNGESIVNKKLENLNLKILVLPLG